MTDVYVCVFKPDESIINAAYALGDAADVKGGELPTTAEVACQKAEYLARCFNFDFQIDEAFAYSQKALVTYIGQHDGVNGGNKDWSGAKAVSYHSDTHILI